MCGRYTHLYTWQQLYRLMMLTTMPAGELAARYNVAPSQNAPVVRADGEGGRTAAMLRWGLVPSWAEDPAIGSRLINARSETAAGKPAFRGALRRRRCIVPVSGFYEWRKDPGGGRKQPFYFYPVEGETFGLAGLWESWKGDKRGAIESFTILTVPANELVRPVHDRMPVILSPEQYTFWLDPEVMDAERVLGLLGPCDPALMGRHTVGTRVNSPANDDPECIAPEGGGGDGGRENLFGGS